jgi:thymidine kinase
MNKGLLTFYYGTMNSSKTANALMLKYSLEQKKVNVLLLKPSIDTRESGNIVKSRVGLMSEAVTFDSSENLKVRLKQFDFGAIILDECQFATADQIEQLKQIAIENNINVYCYGLKTDFTSHLFEGSQRLVELADKLVELETYCECGNLATINARFVDGKLVKTGEQIVIGDDMYKPMCYNCWHNQD